MRLGEAWVPSRRSTRSPRTRKLCGVSGGIERVALLEHDRLALAPFDPRLRGSLEDVDDLDVRMRMERRLVAGLSRLDPGAHGRRPLVVADDRLVVGQRPEADALRLGESNDRGLLHRTTLLRA